MRQRFCFITSMRFILSFTHAKLSAYVLFREGSKNPLLAKSKREPREIVNPVSATFKSLSQF